MVGCNCLCRSYKYYGMKTFFLYNKTMVYVNYIFVWKKANKTIDFFNEFDGKKIVKIAKVYSVKIFLPCSMGLTKPGFARKKKNNIDFPIAYL